ncbi:MAG: peptidylprolyl isomerase [Verrucomicrobium sp.]|nr:peptidylprolyl isomerase [Verrucomicrobium sp.]
MALIINGETIDDEIIEEEFRHIKGHYERALQVSCCERDPEFRGIAKDNLASRALLQQESVRRFPEVPPTDIDARLAKLVEQAGGEDQFYASIGMPFKDESLLQSNLANGVRMDKMLIQVYAPEPEPAEEEIKAFYEANVKLFLTEEQIRVSHITLSLSGAKSRADVYQLMRELREQALGGGDFDALGAEHNSNKDLSPDLGWFKKGEFMEEFEAIAFSMRDGEISPVFTTQLGFHICRLTERKPAVPKPLEEVKDEVRARILEAYRDGKFNEFIEDLKTSAKIEDTEPEEACGCGTGHC